jgi:hypothetical protein
MYIAHWHEEREKVSIFFFRAYNIVTYNVPRIMSQVKWIGSHMWDATTQLGFFPTAVVWLVCMHAA